MISINKDARARLVTVSSNAPIDISANVPDISWYRFIADTGNATLNGFFVDIQNQRLGNAFTSTIGLSAVSLAQLYGGTLPSGACGLVFDLSGNVRYDIAGPDSTASDLAIGNASKYPTMEAGKNLAIGRIT